MIYSPADLKAMFVEKQHLLFSIQSFDFLVKIGKNGLCLVAVPMTLGSLRQ